MAMRAVPTTHEQVVDEERLPHEHEAKEHGSMERWEHGSLGAWKHASMVSWAHESMLACSRAPTVDGII